MQSIGRIPSVNPDLRARLRLSRVEAFHGYSENGALLAEMLGCTWIIVGKLFRLFGCFGLKKKGSKNKNEWRNNVSRARAHLSFAE